MAEYKKTSGSFLRYLVVLGAALGSLAYLEFKPNETQATEPVPSLRGIINNTKVDHAINDIYSGRLSYSKRCGWVDWGHAVGDGPKDLVKHVLTETSSPLSLEDKLAVQDYSQKNNLSLKQYTPIVYYQQMTKEYAGAKIKVGTRSVYLVKKNLSAKIREGVAWRIFKDVSNQFENMQGKLPYGLLPSTAASSFGIGDLNGDKISFYSALRGYSKKDIEKICGSYNVADSLKQFKKESKNPKGQKRWKKIPKLISVPYIPKGVVLTVINNGKFFGDYP